MSNHQQPPRPPSAANAVLLDESAVANSRMNGLELELDDENHFNNGVIVIIDEVEVVEPPPPHLPPPQQQQQQQKLPDACIAHMLDFISDRTAWESVASSNRKIREISKGKKHQPPWPRNFLLKNYFKKRDDSRRAMYQNPVWSPDGTQIACIDVYSDESSNIVIFDQRHGQLRLRLRLRRDDDEDLNVENGNGNDEIHWLAHDNRFDGWLLPILKFSPDGSFLVSASQSDGFVRIWDYNSTDGYGYYQKLQEWAMDLSRQHHFGPYSSFWANISFDISPCCRYVAVSFYERVLLKDIKNNENTIKSVLLHVPAYPYEMARQILFSNKIDDHNSIFIHSFDDVDWDHQIQSIKIWRPNENFNDEDGRVGTMLQSIQQKTYCYDWSTFCLSRDRSMIAKITEGKDSMKVTIYSYDTTIESTENILLLKRTFDASPGPILFTPDDKYIKYNNKYGFAFMEISTGIDITENMRYSFNYRVGRSATRGSRNKINDKKTLSFSPVGNGQRLIVQDGNGYRIASYWESKVHNN